MGMIVVRTGEVPFRVCSGRRRRANPVRTEFGAEGRRVGLGLMRRTSERRVCMVSSVEDCDRVREGDTVIGLVEVEPELARMLTVAEREEARGFALRVGIVEKDDDPRALLERSGAFGGLVLDGLLLEGVKIDESVSLRLLGPGAPISPRSVPIPLPWMTSRVFAPVRTRVVLLDERYLFAARRWPSLARALHGRMSEDAKRHGAQLAISHLPRVEDRLMALMWLLADTWGRVTPAGIRLELSLSHEALGGLIGARRSTVTLALGKLAERNVLIRQDRYWLILEQPTPADTAVDVPQVALAPRAPSDWGAAEPESPSETRGRLLARAAELRGQAVWGKDRARRLRERSAALYAQAAVVVSDVLPAAPSAHDRSDAGSVRAVESDPLLERRRNGRRGERIRRSGTSIGARV